MSARFVSVVSFHFPSPGQDNDALFEDIKMPDALSSYGKDRRVCHPAAFLSAFFRGTGDQRRQQFQCPRRGPSLCLVMGAGGVLHGFQPIFVTKQNVDLGLE